ncbi:hybrid sensor histidine kinase/response regulator [Clostridium sp. P21]|uniref:Stage 0 sporulation protein A homolog n=1 Tax=Clostridium muellerianum TaxID=2716538 RepID=A0A7Y0HN65_9CLOT|nr:hybrid sensor histidine kinase/response regulator [Clostridium muellerianum]NMM63674.1 hybrid sensor histidine kinase/response regulator [Clostridium muellerianum]
MNTNDDEFLKKLISTFKIEAHDHLKNISLSLLELEKSQGDEKKSVVETIHREFHSLKGAARAVNIEEIETICHRVENIFSDIKKEKLVLNEEMFDVVNESVDIMEEIISFPNDIRDISKIIRKIENVALVNNSKQKLIEVNNVVAKKTLEIKKLQPLVKSKTDVDLRQEYNKKQESVKVSIDKLPNVIRVSKDKLDSLLIQGEEMLYIKLSANETVKEAKAIKELLDLWKKEKDYNYIKMIENSINSLIKSSENDESTVETMMNKFMEDIKDIMLLPFSYILEMFPKMVRDLSKKMNKKIEFISEGTKVEIDRRILEEIKDPFMHIIRNCVDHGIEKPEERKKLGKSPKGTIKLIITQISGDKVKIQISDDGSGININKVKEKAAKNHILTQSEIKNIDDESVKTLIFKSGISTSDIITDISGRGLGLAIVHEKIQNLDGTISIETEADKGTAFNIILPITISTNRGIIVKVSNQEFVVPTGKVEKVIRIKNDEIELIENRAVVVWQGYIIPIFDLKDILEISDSNIEKSSSDIVSILIINFMEQRMALKVDEIVVEQEVLVKRFNKPLKRVKNISGATILGSGRVVPILNVQDLIKSSFKHKDNYFKVNSVSEEKVVEKKSIIVVDDSITSRTLLKNILENYGYQVKTAVDGLQGWRLMENEKFDLVVTDIEMPVMDGFELTKRIRDDSKISDVPVVLVTSLESKEDKERGIDVGASAYIVKSDFRQSSLLDTIKRLI